MSKMHKNHQISSHRNKLKTFWEHNILTKAFEKIIKRTLHSNSLELNHFYDPKCVRDGGFIL